jgi:hypothetical protein
LRKIFSLISISAKELVKCVTHIIFSQYSKPNVALQIAAVAVEVVVTAAAAAKIVDR